MSSGAVLVSSGPFWFVLVCSGAVLVCSGMVPVGSGKFWEVLVDSGGAIVGSVKFW